MENAVQDFGPFVGCAGLGMMPAMSKGAGRSREKPRKNHEHPYHSQILQCQNGADTSHNIVRRNLPKCLPL
jgi:hypothetical protein